MGHVADNRKFREHIKEVVQEQDKFKDPKKHIYYRHNALVDSCDMCGHVYSLHIPPPEHKQKTVLPDDEQERKKIPMASGLLDYFPSALAEVARVSHPGNLQHNGNVPLFWARGKSTDQADTILRHLTERGRIDKDGMRHSAKAAWRCLALLQLELESEGAPLARGAKLPEVK